MKVILIDAMHLAHRMHFTHEDLHTHKFQPTGVLHGVLSNMLWLQERYPDFSMVFCWDQGTSWRCKIAPDVYKANRYPSDARLRVDDQVYILQKEMLDVLGIRQISINTIEGDDIVGILAHGLEKRKDVEQVLIYSGDKDFFQLVDGSKISVIRVGKFTGNPKENRIDTIDPKAVMDRFGIQPKQWNHFRALAGDSSDGMKAIDGIGPKTAVVLLGMGVDPSKQDSQAGIPKAISDNPKWAALKQRWEMVHLCYRMSCIPRTVQELTVPKAVRNQLEIETNSIVASPGRVPRKALGQKFMENLTKYELQYCMGKRRQFWLIP